MARPAVVVALPPGESVYVCAELARRGSTSIEVAGPAELKRALDSRRDIGLAVLDGEIDDDEAGAFEAARSAPRATPIAALTVVSPRALERFAALETGGTGDEYFTRPYSADSIRWRVEAMCIRRETVDDGSGPVLQRRRRSGWAAGTSGPRPSPSSTRRAASARRPSRRTSPQRSRLRKGKRSCSSTPTR